MKKIYLIKAFVIVLSLCCIQRSFSQNIPPNAEIDNSFYNRMNFVFSPLEKNRVPYGLLKDFAMEFTDLGRYNGSVNDSNYVDQGDFFDIYQTLFTSRIHSNAGTWVNPIVADSLWYLQRTENVITIGGLCYGYSSFREDAYSNSLLTVINDQIHDKYVNGIWQTPYQTALSVAFAPAVNEHKGRNISVLIPSVAWFTNQQVSSIQLDAGNGDGYQTIAVGQLKPIFYPDSGLKTMNFKVTLANNEVLYSHSQIHIVNAVNPADDAPVDQYRTFSLAANGPILIESDETYEGKKAYGYMTIRYANPDKQLRRPLIVAEGYDPGNILNPEEKFGENDIEQFNNEILNGTGQSVLRNLLFINPQYDIVYVDWKNGTDNLYRNAKLLKKVIALVNADKVAVNGVIQPNVVLGRSMGGVITRIALKEMENAGINHQTRLFISQDSPQQGANVPIAYQYMARHFRNIYISTGPLALVAELIQLIRGRVSPFAALSLSNQPGSKQMLINYISDISTLSNVYHDNFYASLRALGYPAQCRTVAMSNGSECANSQGLEPGASLLSIDGKIQTRFLGDLSLNALSFGVHLLFPSALAFKLGILPGKNEIRANINLHAIGNGGGNQVYYCDITYTKKLFYLVNINVTLAHKEKNADSGMIPIDGYPGGALFPTEGLKSSYSKNWFYKYNINFSANTAFNFVPTTSSLDIGGGATALNSYDFLRVYSAFSPPSAPKQTPFANFIIARQNNASINEDHISFNARNADWVGNEIGTVAAGPNPQIVDCSYLCSGNLEIQGPVQFCTSQTYSIPGLQSGTSIAWSASPTGVVNTNSSGNSVTLTKTNNGSISLTANITSACGNTIVSKAIVVGTPNPSVSSYVDRTPQSSHYQYVTATATQIPGTVPSNYSWYSVLNGNSTFISSGLQLVQYGIPPCSVVYYKLVANTPCGDAIYNGYAYNSYCSSSKSATSMAIYPSPASTEVNISNMDAEGLKSDASNIEGTTIDGAKAAFQVKLYDGKGNLIRSAKNPKGSNGIKLNVAEVPNGTYFLHVVRGKETIKQQIIISH